MIEYIWSIDIYLCVHFPLQVDSSHSIEASWFTTIQQNMEQCLSETEVEREGWKSKIGWLRLRGQG